jgi:hypothetical protein
VKDEAEFGNRRNEEVIDMVRAGEALLFYVRTPVKSVVAVYKAVSVAETDSSRLWADGIYAKRIRISVETPINISYDGVIGKLIMNNGKVINNRQQERLIQSVVNR